MFAAGASTWTRTSSSIWWRVSLSLRLGSPTLFQLSASIPGFFVTSEITLAEALAPSKTFGPRSAELKQRYMEAIVDDPMVTLVPVTRSILLETVRFRDITRLKPVDAIHCVSALQTQCQHLISRDRDLARQLPPKIIYCDGSMSGLRAMIATLDS